MPVTTLKKDLRHLSQVFLLCGHLFSSAGFACHCQTKLLNYNALYLASKSFFISPAFLISNFLFSGISFNSGTPAGGVTSGLQLIALVVLEMMAPASLVKQKSKKALTRASSSFLLAILLMAQLVQPASGYTVLCSFWPLLETRVWSSRKFKQIRYSPAPTFWAGVKPEGVYWATFFFMFFR